MDVTVYIYRDAYIYKQNATVCIYCQMKNMVGFHDLFVIYDFIIHVGKLTKPSFLFDSSTRTNLLLSKTCLSTHGFDLL